PELRLQLAGRSTDAGMRTEPAALLAIDHEELVIRRGRRSGIYTAIAVHSTTLGPALGGCRMWRYPDQTEAARDALRLSRAMTLKASAAGLDLGGGKGVICLPPDMPTPEGGKRRDVLLDFADAVNARAGWRRPAHSCCSRTSTRASARSSPSCRAPSGRPRTRRLWPSSTCSPPVPWAASSPTTPWTRCAARSSAARPTTS